MIFSFINNRKIHNNLLDKYYCNGTVSEINDKWLCMFNNKKDFKSGDYVTTSTQFLFSFWEPVQHLKGHGKSQVQPLLHNQSWFKAQKAKAGGNFSLRLTDVACLQCSNSHAVFTVRRRPLSSHTHRSNMQADTVRKQTAEKTLLFYDESPGHTDTKKTHRCISHPFP